MAEQPPPQLKKKKWRGKHDLKVIGTGFSRTGSYSLKMALEELGFVPCWHIIDVMGDEEKAQALMWWNNIERRLKQDKESVEFDEFYKNLGNNAQSAVDWPTSFYWAELAEYYPNMKMILGVRDKQKWHRSCLFALNLYFYNPLLRILAALHLVDIISFCAFQLIPKSVEEFGGIDVFYHDQQKVFDRIDERIEIMKTDPRYKDRVLIFKVTDGWEPLCTFLGVDVPKDKPFPRSNDAKAFSKNINAYMWKRINNLIGNRKFLMSIGCIITVVGILFSFN